MTNEEFIAEALSRLPQGAPPVGDDIRAAVATLEWMRQYFEAEAWDCEEYPSIAKSCKAEAKKLEAARDVLISFCSMK